MKYIPYLKSINNTKIDIIKIVKIINWKDDIMNMKFVKGILVGGLITTGVMMMCTDNSNSMYTKKMAQKGKRFAKKMGIM